MIAWANSIKGGSGVIAYGANPAKGAIEIYRNLVMGISPNEIAAEFNLTQSLNHNCKNTYLSIILSPNIKDGDQLKRHNFSILVAKFVQKMGLSQHQSVAYLHQDRRHKHIHLYVNRIGFDGKPYRDSFIGFKSQSVAREVASEMNLQIIDKTIFKKNKHPYSKEIIEIHEKVTKGKSFIHFDHYDHAMRSYGVKVAPYQNKSQEIQGFLFEYNGISQKASEVLRTLSGANLLLQILTNDEIDKIIRYGILQKEKVNLKIKQSVIHSLQKQHQQRIKQKKSKIT